MVSIGTWGRYLSCKFNHSILVGRMALVKGLRDTEALDMMYRSFLQGRLTFVHCNKGEEKAPMTRDLFGTLLVRKLPFPDLMRVDVRDVVVLKDPVKDGNYIVRRLAAVEGDEMLSTNKDDEAFVLEKDQCWVVADDQDLSPQEAHDSRTFGPVAISNIVGRVIYCLRNVLDHGPINNSAQSKEQDFPVLEVELDIDAMAKDHEV